MLCTIYRPLLCRLLSLARRLPRLAPRVLQPLVFSAFSLFCLVLPSNAFADQITLAWDAPKDPRIAGYILYYGSARGSFEGVVDVGTATTYTLPDLEEGQVYTFAIASYDANGDGGLLSREMVVDSSTVEAAGNSDENGLSDQDEADQVEADGETVGDDDQAGLEEGAAEISADEHDTMSDPEQVAAGDEETARSAARTDSHVIPQAHLKIVSVDSEPLKGDGAADSAIDGQVETYWHTEMAAKAPIHPHTLVIALGEEYMVRGFRYLPRQDGRTEGMVARYSFYVSEDGVNWGKAIATGAFARDRGEQEVMFPEKTGSFVRFVAHSEVNGAPSTTVAELNVLGVR